MKGDILVIQKQHKRVAKIIATELIPLIRKKENRYVITISGESGCGKSEVGKAISDELLKNGIDSVLLGQDDYFVFPPKINDQKRREDSEWLGPHVEVKLDDLEQNLVDAINGKDKILKPLVDYDRNIIMTEIVDIKDAQVIIAEGTYTSLLRHVDTRVFISRDWKETLKHRQKRQRGNEVGDPFIEHILRIEHKIIAGHKQLADILINSDYSVEIVN